MLEPDSLSGIGEDHVGLTDPDGGRITAEYSVGHSPCAVTAGGGSVWVANRLGNQHFRPSAARPAGFADRIEIKVTPLGRVETHTAAIERGSADLTWLLDFPLRGFFGPPGAPPASCTASRRPGPIGCS